MDTSKTMDQALDQLFADYPEIRTKRAYAIQADEYVDAFMTLGDPVDVAISKAGEAVGEEFGLKRQPARDSEVDANRARSQEVDPDVAEASRVISKMAGERPGSLKN